MKVRIVAAGTKMPDWVLQPCRDYLRRIPGECQVLLSEVPLERRSKAQSTAVVKRRETMRLLEAVPRGDYLVALDERGQSISTTQLADRLQRWQMDGRDISLLIGGPDGLDFDVIAATQQWPDWRWSLSGLTLPHPLVRIFLVEQLYRACSINSGHPYHRQ